MTFHQPEWRALLQHCQNLTAWLDQRESQIAVARTTGSSYLAVMFIPFQAAGKLP